jgi:deoxyadenosine/deoxycytidine kinase
MVTVVVNGVVGTGKTNLVSNIERVLRSLDINIRVVRQDIGRNFYFKKFLSDPYDSLNTFKMQKEFFDLFMRDLNASLVFNPDILLFDTFPPLTGLAYSKVQLENGFLSERLYNKLVDSFYPKAFDLVKAKIGKIDLLISLVLDAPDKEVLLRNLEEYKIYSGDDGNYLKVLARNIDEVFNHFSSAFGRVIKFRSFLSNTDSSNLLVYSKILSEISKLLKIERDEDEKPGTKSNSKKL